MDTYEHGAKTKTGLSSLTGQKYLMAFEMENRAAFSRLPNRTSSELENNEKIIPLHCEELKAAYLTSYPAFFNFRAMDTERMQCSKASCIPAFSKVRLEADGIQR